MESFTALLIGDFRREEFCQVAETIANLGQTARVDTVADALARMDSDPFTPDLIVLATGWPGQFDHGSLYALRRRAPLARFLSVLGSWCEGETRSGTPWPGLLRTYWHHWLPYWSGEWQQFARQQLTTWGLAQTATDEERLMSAATDPASGRGLILVKSASWDMADMLCQACRQRGYGAVWMPPHREGFATGVSALLWDGPDVDVAQLRRCSKVLPSAPIIALVDFPRIEEARRAREAGVAIVMGKPLRIDDLFRQLEQLAAVQPPSPQDGGPLAAVRREVA